MAGTASIYTTLAFNSFLFLLLVTIFEFFRTREIDIYAPRTRGTQPTAPKVKNGFFAWVYQVYSFSDEDILRRSGMDSFVLIRFLTFCTHLCAYCSIGAIILMPVYFYSLGTEDATGMDKISMANVDANGMRLWASFAFAYIFTGLFLYLIHQEYAIFMAARNRFFLGCDHDIPAQMNFSIQVENIPPDFRTSGKLKEFFERIFPNEVLYATVEVSTPDLDRAVAERSEVVRQLEEAVADYEASDRMHRPLLNLVNGKPQRVAYCAVCTEEHSTPVDRIDYLKDQLSVVCAEVAALQKKALAVTDELDQELESGTPGNRSPFSSRPHSPSPGVRAPSFSGSAVSTSTLDSSLGINASAPHHIKHHSRAGSPTPTPSGVNGGASVVGGSVAASSAQEESTVRSALHAHAGVALNVLTKQSSQASVRLVNASQKVTNVVVSIKDHIESNLASATGFVTFKTRRAMVSAAQVPVISQQYPKVTASPAPAPSDIIWANVSVTTEHTESVAYATSIFYYTGLLFWSVVLASVAALSNLDTLQKYLPFLSVLGATSRAVLQGLLPVVIVLLFSLIVHLIMDTIARRVERRKTQSAIQLEIFKWYFMYQIANVYLLLLAGSVFDSLESAINDPASIVDLISAALPKQSVFFVNYILTSWFAGVPLILLQIVPTLLVGFYRGCFNPLRVTRPMLKNGPFFPYEVEYGTTLPDMLYILCIVLLYWVISPVILLFGTGYFFCSLLAYKYTFTFVNIRSYESGGLFFYGWYKYAMMGLCAASVLFITYMGIKQGVLQTPLLAPLPLLIVYCWRYTERQFKVLSQNIPFDTAVRDDDDRMNAAHSEEEEHQHLNHQQLLETFTPEFLKQPNITRPAVVFPYPHRIQNEPLLTRFGALSEVYVEDIPEGMDPKVYVQELSQGQYEAPEGDNEESRGSVGNAVHYVNNSRLHA